ncbi:hypothetical protein [Novosphingobium sp. AP12]|uniref:hypothetical protein n=1 Tax=Novosphingobium sp. AP12 TaxID=1144305 RepID=UPI0002721F50|nr:hypothetical protein [Novosphingobium sp. AP12]EJL23653.1 hypothetical protein PMI02_04092 [Novosphingobium sp. AP12]
MLITSLMLCAFAIAVFLIAGAVAAICRPVTNSRGVSLMAGTLAIPALISASLIYWLSTMESDDAPPGMVIIGNVTAIAVITPLALFASHLTTKFMDRRAARNAQLSQRTTLSSRILPDQKRPIADVPAKV